MEIQTDWWRETQGGKQSLQCLSPNSISGATPAHFIPQRQVATSFWHLPKQQSYLSCSLRRPNISESLELEWELREGGRENKAQCLPSLMKGRTHHPGTQVPCKYFPTADKDQFKSCNKDSETSFLQQSQLLQLIATILTTSPSGLS